MKILDLTLGHPRFMEPYWHNMGLSSGMGATSIKADAQMAYGDRSGSDDLKRKIISLHNAVGNAETQDRHVLVGHGATQILNAVLAQSPHRHVYARPPYFFRFPQIFQALSLIEALVPDPQVPFVELITAPSNPDFEIYPETGSDWKVHDFCYNWPQYGPVLKHDKPIMVFSLAKSTGHAGSRIGWALIKDKDIYDRACEFIDISSGGVSRDAQWRATHLLETQAFAAQSFSSFTSVFEYGRDVLVQRWNHIRTIQAPRLKILNRGGMFLWCELEGSQNAADEIMQLYGIKGLDGRICGGTSQNVRFNMGCTNEDFQEFMSRLK